MSILEDRLRGIAAYMARHATSAATLMMLLADNALMGRVVKQVQDDATRVVGAVTG